MGRDYVAFKMLLLVEIDQAVILKIIKYFQEILLKQQAPAYSFLLPMGESTY